MSKVKLAVCQLRTETDMVQTLKKAEEMIHSAAESGADIVALPEMFNCPYSKEYFRKFAALGHKEVYNCMSRWAAANQIILVGGSVPEQEDGKLYNTCFIFGRDGKLLARHRKVHLFDMEIPGKLRVFESHTFAPGSDITVFDTEFGTIGVAVCYDVRFPELFRAMEQRGARIIFLPAQFNTVTGPKHWKALLASRALDYGVYMVGAAAARYEGFSYECYGHSAVIDPYGETVAECDEKEQILFCEIDTDTVEEIRQRLPISKSLRRDVYTVTK